jgi:hypothetical protein
VVRGIGSREGSGVGYCGLSGVWRSGRGIRADGNVKRVSSFAEIELKSLILAQIERWRHALHMQVERQRGGNPGGERRTGE